MAEEPRVTRFRINWGDGPAESVPLDGETDMPAGPLANGSGGFLLLHFLLATTPFSQPT